MSHTTSIDAVKIFDVKALESAVKDMQKQGVKCTLVKDAVPRMYFKDQHGKCDYVLKLENSEYDVGFQKQEDGSYAPVFDEHMGYVSKHLGSDMKGQVLDTPIKRAQQHIGKMMREYTKHATINHARKLGHTVQSCKVDKFNNVKIVIAGY